MGYYRKKKHGGNNRWNFIILPIIFAISAYLILIVALYPMLKPVISILDTVLVENRFDSAAAGSYVNLYEQQTPPPVEEDNRVKLSALQMPTFGDAFGKLTISNTLVDATLFFGDGNRELKNGVGMYNGSSIPGYGSTTLIGGHNNTFFNNLKNVKVGDAITIATNYGEYQYEIVDTKVLHYNDPTAFDLAGGEDNVVLYTCYPFDMLGLTPQRFFVYGTYLSGPLINKDE